jgi:alpha-mannosidase
LTTRLAIDLPGARLIHDHPYGLSEIRAERDHVRKYPTGDWMTTPQVFETIDRPFTSLQLLDVDDGRRGLLVLHDGSQAMHREDEASVRHVLSMHDPWDEDYFVAALHARVRLVPHARLENATRWRLAQEFTRPALVRPAGGAQVAGAASLLETFSAVGVAGDGVFVTAFYREDSSSGAQLENYAGHGIAHPYIVRLVEFNGRDTVARLTVPGPVAAAFRTNLLGQGLERLHPASGQAPGIGQAVSSELSVPMRPYEIATLYLDLTLGRKQTRNLDAYRYIWADARRMERELDQKK